MMKTLANMTGPINIGNTGESTMLELAEVVVRLTRIRSRIVFRPLPHDDSRQKRPDIAVARQ